MRRVYRKKEEKVQLQVCNYLKQKYPFVIFHSDGNGLHLNKFQAISFSKLKCSRGIPDLFIAEPKKGYSGLYLEIKKDKSEVYTKKHKIRKTPHIQEQFEMLERLKDKGYYASFGCGFDSCIKLIDWYLK